MVTPQPRPGQNLNVMLSGAIPNPETDDAPQISTTIDLTHAKELYDELQDDQEKRNLLGRISGYCHNHPDASEQVVELFFGSKEALLNYIPGQGHFLDELNDLSRSHGGGVVPSVCRALHTIAFYALTKEEFLQLFTMISQDTILNRLKNAHSSGYTHWIENIINNQVRRSNPGLVSRGIETMLDIQGMTSYANKIRGILNQGGLKGLFKGRILQMEIFQARTELNAFFARRELGMTVRPPYVPIHPTLEFFRRNAFEHIERLYHISGNGPTQEELRNLELFKVLSGRRPVEDIVGIIQQYG